VALGACQKFPPTIDPLLPGGPALAVHCMSVKTGGRCNDTDIRDKKDKKNKNPLFNPCRQLTVLLELPQ